MTALVAVLAFVSGGLTSAWVLALVSMARNVQAGRQS